MSDVLSSMNDDEVRQIALLVETLDKSTFDYLQIDVGHLKVTIGKGSMPTMSALSSGASTGIAAIPAQAQTVALPAASIAPAPAIVAAPPAAQVEVKKVAAQDGTVDVVAPMMGRFYAKPEPGSAPFVSVGSTVEKDATVGLIEIMKVFNAVQAGVTGVISEICVQDAQFIEFGQVLFRIRPAQTGIAPVETSIRP